MQPQPASVDVAINAYGKPYQTAITLLTLLKHSGQWIDKIYFVEERKQPEPVDFKFIFKMLGQGKIIYYRPLFWFWYKQVNQFLQKFGLYRRAIRYQYAWEKTDKKFLLIIHNDLYFSGDLVGEYLKNIGDHTGIGKIGQCWNCPAHSAGLCDGDRYLNYRPSYEEIMRLNEQYPGPPRSKFYAEYIEKDRPWPLPECRLNEYVALVNLEKAKPDTVPYGKATPFGIINVIDVGVAWFHQLNNEGHTFANFDYDPYVTHSWVSLKNAGHEALFNKDLYKYEEEVALKVLKEEFGYQPAK
ncbi:hypothetical protein [Dyadobacter luticola]|uniref:Glycosyltransferase n=1 Tax=Dyadobacter luticola TaxID=1979387 RepID=A0A5R9KT77_9BACT|nr:hypothetical protein [Dyadobacter luticola]TLU99339.1 hypothetical protein FEN17_22505 [Dyadobacter luticola]